MSKGRHPDCLMATQESGEEDMARRVRLMSSRSLEENMDRRPYTISTCCATWGIMVTNLWENHNVHIYVFIIYDLCTLHGI